MIVVFVFPQGYNNILRILAYLVGALVGLEVGYRLQNLKFPSLSPVLVDPELMQKSPKTPISVFPFA